MIEDLKQNLFEVIKILEEYLPNIVLGGGWASLIYYQYLWMDKSKFPILTKDFDFMVEKIIPISGRTKLIKKLALSGLKPINSTITNTPVGHFEGKIDGTEISIEFLTHAGNGRRKQSIEVQSGVWAQTLEYLIINVENKIPVVIDIDGKDLAVWVPKPAAFIFNKGLIFTRRQEKLKQEKDLYYIFDLLVFRYGQWDELLNDLKEIANVYPANWFKTFKEKLKKYFIEEPQNGINMVIAQKPTDAFNDYNDDQFKNYVEHIFKSFFEEIEKLN